MALEASWAVSEEPHVQLAHTRLQPMAALSTGCQCGSFPPPGLSGDLDNRAPGRTLPFSF